MDYLQKIDLSLRAVKVKVKHRRAFMPALYDSHVQELSLGAECFVFQFAEQI